MAWGRRGRFNRAMFAGSILVAAFVTAAFIWATASYTPGDFGRYIIMYWVWGLTSVGLVIGLAEYKTSPLRKGQERGYLWILLYLGSLEILTQVLNMYLYYRP